MLHTPVAFFIFNRPEQTQRVFAEIARAQPRRLLVIADGPRNAAEAEKCRATRAILEQVDWECEVLTNLSDTNMGCKPRMYSGLNWVFEQCEDAIILEDDCLPHPSFFRFCTELLERYRHEPRVMVISGNMYLLPKMQQRIHDSYYFSHIPHTWGWASWRRVWQQYDLEVKQWARLRETDFLSRRSQHPQFRKFWEEIFDASLRGATNAWDYQLTFELMAFDGLAATPRANLVSNIGFGADATHTFDTASIYANMPAVEMAFPLRHPSAIKRNVAADDHAFQHHFLGQSEAPPLWRRALNKAGRSINRLFQGARA